jgi:hypothetical protein
MINLEFLDQFAWVVHVALGMLMIKTFGWLFNVSFREILSDLVGEIRELASLDWNCRSINAVGLIVTFAVGSFIIVSDVADRMATVIMSHLGEDQAEQLARSISPATLFYMVIAATLVSTYLVRRHR